MSIDLDTLRTARTQIAAMRLALEPFASVAQWLHDHDNPLRDTDDMNLALEPGRAWTDDYYHPTVADLRRARGVLMDSGAGDTLGSVVAAAQAVRAELVRDFGSEAVQDGRGLFRPAIVALMAALDAMEAEQHG